MSFGGFLDGGGGGGGGGGGARIVADLPYANSNSATANNNPTGGIGGGNMPTGAIAPPRLITQSLTKSMFNSPGLSLALVTHFLPLFFFVFSFRLICVFLWRFLMGLKIPQTNMDGGQGDLAARLPEGFEHNVGRRGREDEHESRSGSDNMDGGSGDDQDAADNPPRKKRYHRHTPQQIQELEAYDSLFYFCFCVSFLFLLQSIFEANFLGGFDFLSVFKECPHPDEKQRLELSRRLCLETRQVKFWFQNRRTQMKVIDELHHLFFFFPLF